MTFVQAEKHPWRSWSHVQPPAEQVVAVVYAYSHRLVHCPLAMRHMTLLRHVVSLVMVLQSGMQTTPASLHIHSDDVSQAPLVVNAAPHLDPQD